jgi:hypothetical protein
VHTHIFGRFCALFGGARGGVRGGSAAAVVAVPSESTGKEITAEKIKELEVWTAGARLRLFPRHGSLVNWFAAVRAARR